MEDLIVKVFKFIVGLIELYFIYLMILATVITICPKLRWMWNG